MSNATVKGAAKAVIAAAQTLDPSRLALPGGRTHPGDVAFIAVYRRRHAERLAALVRQLSRPTTIRLWCLDEPADFLKSWTVGRGPGTRFALLNRLTQTVPASLRRDGLIISDDDYAFRVGGLNQLLAIGSTSGLDLWQPAHGRTSFANFSFVRRQPGVVLRRTTFVEQGPVLILSARAQNVLLPFREDIGMGWGVEIGWTRLAAQHGLRLAIVDALAIRHLPPIGGYDRESEAVQLRLMLDEAGLQRVEDLQQELQRVGIVEGLRLRRQARLAADGRHAADL